MFFCAINTSPVDFLMLIGKINAQPFCGYPKHTILCSGADSFWCEINKKAAWVTRCWFCAHKTGFDVADGKIQLYEDFDFGKLPFLKLTSRAELDVLLEWLRPEKS